MPVISSIWAVFVLVLLLYFVWMDVALYYRLQVGVLHGCQMLYFKTKNPILGKFLRVLKWKVLVYFMALCSILRPFSIFCGHLIIFHGYLVYFFPFWYLVPRKIWQPWPIAYGYGLL
jgi:hypothetical protein